MPVRLLYVNVLIPLLWESDPRHERVKSWFLKRRAEGWATCPITELGFIRISCTPHVMPASPTIEMATGLLKKWTLAADHHFWSDDLTVPNALASVLQNLTGHKQLTDAYLIALARQRGALLATMDRPLARLDGVDPVVI